MPEVKKLINFCPTVSFYVRSDLKNIKICRCCIHLDNKLFNDHILIKVLLRPLKCIAKFFRGSAENPLGDIWFKKDGRKKKGEGHGLHRTLGWSSDFPEVCTNPSEVLGL